MSFQDSAEFLLERHTHHVGVQFFAEFRGFQEWNSAFRAVDDVQQDIRERWWHGAAPRQGISPLWGLGLILVILPSLRYAAPWAIESHPVRGFLTVHDCN